ncbi:transposase [Candidatus Tisiphia endosymbiont of Empis tessellata]|uniref:transposase n=1 Tax=Candidatus Tisiphia endosymbiont of Empis tessellata TaxID=3066259 RepID=UPI00313E0181
MPPYCNRLLSKLAYAEGFEGDASPRTAAYSNSVTDSSTASTYKSPAEVEFRKKSITIGGQNLITIYTGWLFADKGYLGQPIIKQLKKQAVDIFTKVRKNMKVRIMTEIQEFFLGKRGIVETVIDQLKNCCQIEHSRHRSPTNAFVNIISGLIAYCFKPRKPAIKPNKLKAQKLLLTSN